MEFERYYPVLENQYIALQKESSVRQVFEPLTEMPDLASPAHGTAGVDLVLSNDALPHPVTAGIVRFDKKDPWNDTALRTL